MIQNLGSVYKLVVIISGVYSWSSKALTEEVWSAAAKKGFVLVCCVGVAEGVAVSSVTLLVAMAAHSASNGSSRMLLLTSCCHGLIFCR